MVLAIVAPVALFGCGGDESGTPEMTWYINPDNGSQAVLAAECSEASDGAYTIDTQILPNDADAQREQLVRRLAAGDSSIDLMSLDPPFVAEFANAGYLLPITDDADVAQLTADVLDGPLETAYWEDQLVAHALLGEHPAPVVPHVGGRGRRCRSDPSELHVAGDDRRGRRSGKADRRPGPAVRGLHGVDQRARRRRPAARSSRTRSWAPTPHRRSRHRRATPRPTSSASWPGRPPLQPTSPPREKENPSRSSGVTTARSW